MKNFGEMAVVPHKGTFDLVNVKHVLEDKSTSALGAKVQECTYIHTCQ